MIETRRPPALRLALELSGHTTYRRRMIEIPTLIRPGAGVINSADDPDEGPGSIPIHGPEAFEGMRKAGQLAARLLDELVRLAVPEVTTDALDQFAYQYMRDHGALPATMFYRGYSKNICTSINHVVCHGIPSSKRLKDGDIVNIDVTVILDGWHGDTSRMFLIGDVPLRARKLVDTTYEAMMRGIAVAKPGNTLGDIGYAIQSYCEGLRYSVVRDFCGHGLGRRFHTAPSVIHVGRPGKGLVLKPGMFMTIEPMINLGRADVKVLEDGWTAVTRDRSLSAQFEHSIGITEDGPEIFTLSPAGLHQPPFSV
jgi:methionyl aminopeptidase